MKIAPRSLTSFLNHPGDCRAALFFGPDEGVVREHCQTLLSAWVTDAQDPLAITKFSSERVLADPSLLFESLSALSLMGDAPVVVIEQAGDKLTALLKEVLKTPACQNHLAVCSKELPTRSSLRKLFEAEKTFASIGCYPDEGAALSQLIRQTFAAHTISFDADSLHYLSETLGSNRGVTRQELEKISLYLGEGGRLDLETAQSLVSTGNTQNQDLLCQALLDGRPESVHTIASQLMAEGTNAIALLRLIARYVERLRLARYHTATGASTEDALRALRPPVFFKQKPGFTRHLARYSEKALSRLENKMLHLERTLKRSRTQPLTLLHELCDMARRCARA